MESNILDQVYSNVRGAYKAVPWPHFGLSDYISVFLYPAYRQLLKQALPVSKTIKVWNEETDLVLQDCFDSTNWDVFRAAAVREDGTIDLEDYASGVTGEVRSMLHACHAAFLSGNTGDYKRSRYDLRRSIREAKRQYRLKLVGYYTTTDSRCMWQGLQHITNYQQTSRVVTTSHTTLPDELNEFYARFETLNPGRLRDIMTKESTQNTSLTVTSVDVRRTLQRINPRRAAGPDNIPGCALRVCSSELAGMFVDIFNMSLAQAVVPSCYFINTYKHKFRFQAMNETEENYKQI
ncbi:uncharacterized protein LOC118798303 [Colossoma macropomum]|uniref:uncharacterized protein LOC118798303 n=1 Tax=Colossoma macropomum TaxID=42526 RepID=UPI0018646E88|nr:uncharacterized protein LOC118798303 [Colossoma macropomum]